MIEVEFIKDYGSCWKKGDKFTQASRPQFAAVVIEAGYAKAISGPPKDKMLRAAEKIKTHSVISDKFGRSI